ncbi:MAG: DNA polymerase III subunit beta [Mycoplasmoidaceae bacterium]|nr:DNA polymerase III subunit beta [Mycoplasmoidaceae bacterium]
MKFVIEKSILLDCLKNINSLIDGNNINPALSAVHIKSIDNKLFFIATNGENSYQQIIDNVEIKEGGDILIKARLLYNYISKIDQKSITINQIDERILQINTPKSTSEINLIDDSSFPIIDFNYDNWKKMTVQYDDLINIQQRIKPFISTAYTNTNPSIGGILFNPVDEKQIECVASDSFRIGYYKFNYSGEAEKFVIEPKAIDMAVEILTTNKSKSIDLYLSEKKCILSIDKILIQFSLFNKNIYPNIINAILSTTKNSFTVNLNELSNALNRGSVFVSNEQRPIADLKIENKKLTIKFLSSDVGNSFEEIDLINCNVDNFEVKLNQKYFLSLLNTIKSENVTFNFNSGNSPIIISSDNKSFLNLITPLRSL